MGERHSGHVRVAADFYVEEPWASQALFAAQQFGGLVYDPACGKGNILESARRVGLAVMGTDIVDRGCGQAPVNFLSPWRWRAENIITNPPFSLAERFIIRALGIATEKVAILSRVGFLASRRRRALFESTPLARVLIFSDRIRLMPNGEDVGNSPSVDHCWLIWRRGHVGPPTVGWLSRDR